MASSVLYATVAELKAQPGIEASDDDAVITAMLTAASRAVDGFCNRENDGFVASESASARLLNGNDRVYIWSYEMTEITLVELKETIDGDWIELAATDWIAFSGDVKDPEYNFTPYGGIMLSAAGDYSYFPMLNGSADSNTSLGWSSFNSVATSDAGVVQRTIPSVRVTAKWGYSTLAPNTVKQATIIQAAKWFKRGQSFWADTAADDNSGTLMFTKALDPDVKFLLELSRLKRPIYAGR